MKFRYSLHGAAHGAAHARRADAISTGSPNGETSVVDAKLPTADLRSVPAVPPQLALHRRRAVAMKGSS